MVGICLGSTMNKHARATAQSHRRFWPTLLFQDRYGGSYSGEPWIAVANADEFVEETSRADWVMRFGPSGGDLEAPSFECIRQTG